MKLIYFLLAPFVVLSPLAAQSTEPAPILAAMKQELDRSMSVLRQQPQPPYFISYLVTERRIWYIRAAFGAVQASQESYTRQLSIDLRVGSYKLDNTHEIRGEYSGQSRYSYVLLPVDDDPEAIRTTLWLETDRRYKRALEEFTRVRTNKAVKVKEEDASDDLSHEPVESSITPPVAVSFNRPAWEGLLRRCTGLFRSHPEIFSSQGWIQVSVDTRYYVNSEGTLLQHSSPSSRLAFDAMCKADDGMELPLYESYFAFLPEGLPREEELVQSLELMIANLDRLRAAPIVDPYTGPAILTGGAAGVFFHEVLGHRVEGHRQKSENEGQTFKKKLGEPVLGDSIDLVFDPTMSRFNSSDLSGFYPFDDQGVRSRRVPIIEGGTLRQFLMGRSPIDGFPSSNGHGRAEAGYQPVSRQSNMFCIPKHPVPVSELRTRLISECRKKNLPYGLLFGKIQGGFTLTGRTIPNAFNVLPLLVSRVYVDGRPDEIVRGVDLVGTPLTTFGRIVAAGNDPEVWHGYCGAESGGVPVAQVCPSIFISEVEVQKKSKSQEKPPVLAPPPLQPTSDAHQQGGSLQ